VTLDLRGETQAHDLSLSLILDYPIAQSRQRYSIFLPLFDFFKH